MVEERALNGLGLKEEVSGAATMVFWTRPIFPSLRYQFERHFCSLHNLGDECGIWKTASRMSRLMGQDHHVVDDGRHVNPLGVDDVVNEIGGVVYQAAFVGGKKDVVYEDTVEDLDYRSTILVSQFLRLVDEPSV